MPTENDQPQEEEDTSQETSTQIKPATAIDDTQDINQLPEWARIHIKELRSESKSRRLALNENIEAQRKKDQERLEEQGEYKKLAEELTAELLDLRPLKEKYLARIEHDKQSNEKRIEAIPEKYRSVIPVDYTPDKLSAWLDTNADLLRQPVAPNIDAGAGVNNSRVKPVKLTQLQHEMAKLANMTDEEYAAQLKARTD
jgi:DNA repair exonuclease SbcCD ATPase subunit